MRDRETLVMLHVSRSSSRACAEQISLLYYCYYYLFIIIIFLSLLLFFLNISPCREFYALV